MPLTQVPSGMIADNAVTPDKLSTGAPSWDSSGKVTTLGTLNVPDEYYTGAGVGDGASGSWQYKSGSSGYIVGNTNGVERMRIDPSGNLLVGTTSAGFGQLGTMNSMVGRLAVKNTSNVSQMICWNAAGTSGYYELMSFSNNAGTAWVGSINRVNDNSVQYNTSSDYRLKENIQPMHGALDVVAQLNPVTYTWKADGSEGQGFIAHELQEVVPDCVTGEKDAVDEEGKPVYQGIDTSFLVATLTKAIQELKAEVDDLRAQLAAKV